MGTFAVQLAKQHFGCFVIASSSSKNQQLIKDLGADEAVDYDDPSFLKSMGYTKFDVIVDTVPCYPTHLPASASVCLCLCLCLPSPPSSLLPRHLPYIYILNI